MIIGINGKIGSGKDTVGKIIQYLQCHNTGEITIQDVMSNPEHEWWLEEQSKFEIKKFAGKLKQIGSILSGIVADQFEDQEFKKLYMGVDWDMTYREFLQKLGTEAMREGLHTNVWVNALFADYKPTQMVSSFPPPATEEEYIAQQGYPNWIITDMRFPNEMEAVVEKGGITIRVVREFYEFSNDQHEWRDREDREGNVFIANPDIYSKEESNKEWRNALKERAHASETSLDDHTMHYEIINDGTIEDLVEKVKEILTKQGII
jgi:ABC-type oligopeptide transport system ATPase subunit